MHAHKVCKIDCLSLYVEDDFCRLLKPSIMNLLCYYSSDSSSGWRFASPVALVHGVEFAQCDNGPRCVWTAKCILPVIESAVLHNR